MQRALFYWGGAASLIFVACATSTSPTNGGGGGGDDDSGIPVYDAGGGTQPDGGSPCTLGTADHCGGCDTVCPGDVDAGTTRVCSDTSTTATCDIVCTGEFYDVNGSIGDGCEAEDPIVHDSPDAAVPESATTAGITIGAPYWYAYGDARQHDVAPLSRPNGRVDWYAVTNPDAASISACLTISNFPTDDQFQVCITNNGNKNIDPSACKTITSSSAGASACVSPSMTATKNGTYYVQVQKMSGSNTLNGYALFIQD
jgi:hypothetical protein